MLFSFFFFFILEFLFVFFPWLKWTSVVSQGPHLWKISCPHCEFSAWINAHTFDVWSRLQSSDFITKISIFGCKQTLFTQLFHKWRLDVCDMVKKLTRYTSVHSAVSVWLLFFLMCELTVYHMRQWHWGVGGIK